ncbi:MAG TPA: helix-turn-helix domain-containing protein [Candidatus Limnocylindrales bacterium]|nr:helix-turn-helix domain-containing protein [Candidatus Limnocylindrales bacterium]
MDDLAVGRILRAVRVRRGLRQSDLAAAAGVSQSTVSRLERGVLGPVPISKLRAVAEALEVRATVRLHGTGADLDRLLAAAHSGMHEELARMFSGLPAWVSLPEVTFAIYGERGAIDVLAWHAPTRSLLVIELKTELVDMQETVGTLDRKVRLAMQVARERGWDPLTVSSWLLIAESPRNRRAVAGHAAMLKQRFTSDGHAMAAWLRRPVGRVHALSFLSASHGVGTGRRLAPVSRVRRRGHARPEGAR